MKWKPQCSLSVTAFTFFLVKASFWTVTWSEAVAIFLVLAIHYAKGLMPSRPDPIQIKPEAVQEALAKLAEQTVEIEKIKAALAFRVPGIGK